MQPWLTLIRGDAPLLVSVPHTGTDFPEEVSPRFASLWLARRDADWWVHRLYDFAAELGATLLRTQLSRGTIDVNRDPSGRSLYPGQATTELCPTTTFDGEPLYIAGCVPDAAEIARRRIAYFEPYHATLAAEIARLRAQHKTIVIFDAHSIRSHIPRLFDGELPQFNIGTNSAASCAPALTEAIEQVCAKSNLTRVTNGRFKGGYITRHYGDPAHGVHAVQLELAMRGYMDEPETISPANWPTQYDPARAAALRDVLRRILQTCLTFAGQT
ncbi:MAG TPA: N-formylglutamate deformylase [Rhizomicrobium sp.]|jgi:formiminoglutamase